MNFDASLLVVVAIFGIAYFLLKWFLFDPLLRIMNRRDARIEAAKSAWQGATAQADTALQQERQRLLAARREAAARRDALRREALDQRRGLLEQAKDEAQQRLTAGRAELQAQVGHERQELAARTEELAARISERLVGRPM